MKFRSIVELGGKTATGIEVPASVVEALGSGKKPAVQITLGNHTYRSTVTVMGGRYMIPLSAENRGAAGAAAGDEVEVDLQLDLAPREVTVPDDLATAFADQPAAAERFAALSYSNQRRLVMSIDDAKTPETRQRRVAKVIAEMSPDP